MFTTSFRSNALAAAVVAATIGCSDAPLPSGPTLAESGAGIAALSEGRGAFQRYVAMGTSLSMGVASDGTTAASQEQSWPAQLARMAGREITQPYVDGTGCRSPYKAPLAAGVRISGEAATTPKEQLTCSPLVSGEVSLVQNVAVNGALTRDALFTTPENIIDLGNVQITSRVLLPGHTQISSLEEQNPKFVSIEFGANEILGAHTGVAIPGVTLFPYDAWTGLYVELVDRAAAATKHGLIVGLTTNIANVPGFRRASEIWGQRAVLAAAFNVTVASNCDGSENLVFAPVRIAVAAATGLAMKQANAGAFMFSCAGAPPGVVDYVLTPSELATVNDQAQRMTEFMRAQAARVGFAYTDLDQLFRPDFKPALDVVKIMTTAEPFGPYSSLDGVHPSALGQRVVAEAAARAIDARYNFGMAAQLIASSQ